MKLLTSMFLLYFSLIVKANEFYIGGNLRDYCRNCIDSITVTANSACASCLHDISSMHYVFVELGHIESMWCVKPEITIKQLTDSTLNYIRENPDSLNKYSTNLIADSLAKNYPCN